MTPARLAAVVSSALVWVLASATVANADAPTTWERAEGLSGIEYAALLFGIPALLFGGLWVFGLMTARRNYVPPAPSTDIEPVNHH